MKYSPLFAVQGRLGAQMTEFAGWEMPVLYSSVREENAAVRQRAGLFDVSHLGRIHVEGTGATALVEWLTTIHAGGMASDRCSYGLLLNEAAGILDDLIVLRLAEEEYLLIVNAAVTASNMRLIRWFARQVKVRVSDQTLEQFALALQGPAAESCLQRICAANLSLLRRMHWVQTYVANVPMLVSRTGYTGEDGFEIIGDAADAEKVWDVVLTTGRHENVVPCGLATRDLCRLEAGNRLMGQDMSAATSPLEAGLEWAVSERNERFIGRTALLAEKEHPPAFRWCGFVLDGHVLPRHGQHILRKGQVIGEVTSGNHSFLLERPIGAGYVKTEDARPETDIAIDIRGQQYPARITAIPFYKGKGKINEPA